LERIQPARRYLHTGPRPSPIAEPAVYYDLLRPWAAALDVWETEYQHALEGDDPVVSWTRGTALKPLLDALEDPERSAFLDDYRARMRSAYPRRADGRTLFPFRRLFLVARARS
jgi:trans-aconitate 2-methyltransferase